MGVPAAGCLEAGVGSRQAFVDIAITGLAESFGMTSTAEGVETKDQLDCLRGKNCSEIQGYYYSRPVPQSQVLEVILKINSN